MNKIKSAEMLLCRTGLYPANRAKPGLQSFFRFNCFSKALKIATQFCRVTLSLEELYEKKLLCPSTTRGHHCFARFSPKLIC
jgi:hypothetical protein